MPSRPPRTAPELKVTIRDLDTPPRPGDYRTRSLPSASCGTESRLHGDVAPDSMRIAVFGTFRVALSRSRSALFAAPFTGAAVTRTRRAPSRTPATADRAARGIR